MTEEQFSGSRDVADLELSQRGRTLLRLLSAAWREYERDYARYFASAMVYYALLSLVPLLLLLLGALGLLIRLSDAAAAVEAQALTAISATFGPDLRDVIEQLLDGLERQSLIATVISLLGLVWSASLVMRHLRMSFRAIWKIPPPLVSGPLPVVIRSVVLEKAIAFGMLLAGVLLALKAVALLALFDWLMSSLFTGWRIAIPATLVFVPVTFAFLFRHLPPFRLPWRHVVLSTLLCSTALLLGIEALALYGALVGRNLSVYGAVGSVLVVMLWLNLVAQGLFLGAELCKVSYRWSNENRSPTRPS